MQDSSPVYDLQSLTYALAHDIWPNLDRQFPNLYVHFDKRGTIVPFDRATGQPAWDTVMAGFSDGNWEIRKGLTLNTEDRLFVRFTDRMVSIDQYGFIFRYIGQGDPIEDMIAAVVSDILHDIRSEAEALHVEAQEQDLP